jgi:hypothetical protein
MFGFLNAAYILKGKIWRPYAFIGFSMLLVILASNFFQKYFAPEGYKKVHNMCRIGFFSPNLQLISGLLFIRYRVNLYLVNNLDQDTSESPQIGPFSEYGA